MADEGGSTARYPRTIDDEGESAVSSFAGSWCRRNDFKSRKRISKSRVLGTWYVGIGLRKKGLADWQTDKSRISFTETPAEGGVNIYLIVVYNGVQRHGKLLPICCRPKRRRHRATNTNIFYFPSQRRSGEMGNVHAILFVILSFFASMSFLSNRVSLSSCGRHYCLCLCKQVV